MRQSGLFLHLFKMVFKILGKILQHIRMFQTKMFSDGGSRILVLTSLRVDANAATCIQHNLHHTDHILIDKQKIVGEQ